LTLAPLAGAIAAGNCAVIKPSEISPHTAQAIEQLLTKYLDPECFQVQFHNFSLFYNPFQ
jgi:acyl-CoA reductase-like NAD-dependent aldehyde dehydrogenase